jgi:SprB repeat
MTIQYLKRNQVPTPAPGNYYLFYDLDNGSVLTYKDSDCNFVSLNELPSVDTSAIDDCICAVIKQVVDDSGCALKKQTITATEYESILNNFNLYSVVTIDLATGGYTHSITSSPTLFVQLTTTDVLCNGDTTGTASATVTGGVGPYTLAWADYAGVAANPGALAAGSFRLTVTDANGTIKVVGFVITEPPALALTVNVQNESAPAAADGIASAVVSGGVAPYTYVWNDNLGTPIGQTTQTATGLTAGTYQVIVTDANACIISDLNVVIA